VILPVLVCGDAGVVALEAVAIQEGASDAFAESGEGVLVLDVDEAHGVVELDFADHERLEELLREAAALAAGATRTPGGLLLAA
jgi:hypothetical protein